jgi:hypothetical protein
VIFGMLLLPDYAPRIVAEYGPDARLGADVVRDQNAVRPVERVNHLAGYDVLNGLERAVGHSDACALGYAILLALILVNVVVALQGAELEDRPAREVPLVLRRRVAVLAVDGAEDLERPADHVVHVREVLAEVDSDPGGPNSMPRAKSPSRASVFPPPTAPP